MVRYYSKVITPFILMKVLSQHEYTIAALLAIGSLGHPPKGNNHALDPIFRYMSGSTIVAAKVKAPDLLSKKCSHTLRLIRVTVAMRKEYYV